MANISSGSIVPYIVQNNELKQASLLPKSWRYYLMIVKKQSLKIIESQSVEDGPFSQCTQAI